MADTIKIGNKIFDLKNNTYVMGILNVTPDSFSDGGHYNQIQNALNYVAQMVEEGVDIIDIGGESTRPDYTQISEQEEIERVVPVIKAIKEKYDIPISIDTYKSNVANEALKAGADMVNDIWGLKYDKEMASVVRQYNVPVCIMHNREKKEYTNFLKEVMKELEISIQIAKETGIKDENIILDPGVGFGKTYEQNLKCINHLEDFSKFGYPVLLGASRKSVIGLTLDLPVTEREDGTLVTTVMAVLKGCQFVRVHNVKANVRAIKMAQAILKSN